MIVIADASPLNHLVLIGEAEILQRLYGRVIVPEAVWRELQQPEAPAAVAQWVIHCPLWLEVRQTTSPPDASLRLLGEGERQAILLAHEHRTEALLLMDEGKGRREATQRKLRITGTLEVLSDAAARGWVNLPSALE